MKQYALPLIFISLIFVTSCTKKSEKKISANQATVENFVNELKDIERPAAEQFNLFLSHIDSIGALDPSLSKTEHDALYKKQLDAMRANRKQLDEAVLQFQAQQASIKAMPIDDTLATLLASATLHFDRAYQARAAAIGNVVQYYSLNDNRLLQGYQMSLKLAKEYSDKAFFWITMARQYASGLKAPLLPTLTDTTQEVQQPTK